MSKSKRGRSANSAPDSGRMIYPRDIDAMQYFTTDLTPERAKAIVRCAAAGDPSQQNVLFDEMLENDQHLASVYHTRRMALTGLDWEIVSADQIGKAKVDDAYKSLAEKTADYCRQLLDNLSIDGDGGLDAALLHMSDSIGRATAVVEVEWQDGPKGRQPVALWPVAFQQLRTDYNSPELLRIVTDDSDLMGIPINDPATTPPGKFIIHQPNALGGSRFRGGLLRGSVLGHMFKRYGSKWWLVGVELFGLPFRIVKYPRKSSAAERAEMLRMLKQMGVTGGGILPEGCSFEMHEFNQQGQWPHERLLAFVNAENSKSFLGQTLTTEIGETGGAKAAAVVHDQVRGDLLADDIRKESATIRQMLLRPAVAYAFGPDAPVPHFRRVLEEPVDVAKFLGNVSTMVNTLKLKVPKGYVSETSRIPLTADENPDDPVPGQPAPVDPFAPALTPLTKDLCGLTAHDKLQKIIRGRSGIAAFGAWISLAIAGSGAHTEQAIAAVASKIEDVRSAQDAGRVLAQAFDTMPINDMVELERQYLLAGRLAGMEATRAKAMARRAGMKTAHDRARLVAHAASIDFEPLPFREAISAFKSRLNLDPETFLRLDAEARSRAFRVAGVWNMNLLGDIHAALIQSFEAGETARDFRKRLPEVAERRGWTGDNPWHANIVHYQNFAMATAAGRYEQYAASGAGHWQFVSYDETCELCKPLIGRIFLLSDRTYWPPLHFYCQCQDEVVFAEEVGAGDVADSRTIKAPLLTAYRAEPSSFLFDPAHYGKLEPMRLDTIPDEDLKAVFLAFARKQGWKVAA